MVTLKGETIKLRALEPSDIDFLESTENDESLWQLSNTVVPFSRYQLEQYILNASTDVYESKQLRLVISKHSNQPMGFIDLYEFDPINKKAGVGIVILDLKNRGNGYGREALELMIEYSFSVLDLHQLYCQITESNTQSLRLFESLGFSKVALKKDWTLWDGSFSNEWFLQLINSKHVH